MKWFKRRPSRLERVLAEFDAETAAMRVQEDRAGEEGAPEPREGNGGGEDEGGPS